MSMRMTLDFLRHCEMTLSDKIDGIYDSLQNRTDFVLFSCFNL